MLYKKETDEFEIKIDKNENIRHKLIDLFHELAHVIDFIKYCREKINPLEKGAHLREKNALKIEFNILKKISPKLAQAILGEILLTTRDVLFEIELYSSPNQNLSKLYASTFNKCFKDAKQEDNPSYILKERIS